MLSPNGRENETKNRERMRFIPILFSPLMVTSILQDKKTMTRRQINPQPVIERESGYVYFNKHRYAFDIHTWRKDCTSIFGYVGNILWVRETFYAYGLWKDEFIEKRGKMGPHYHIGNEEKFRARSPRRVFIELWKSINGAESYDKSPWVFAIEFKRIQTSFDFTK